MDNFIENFEVVQKKKIGFRIIRLVQELIDVNNPDKGRSFYFEVNNIPVFLKGLHILQF